MSTPDSRESIMNKMQSPEVLFESENEQSNCPICLEALVQSGPKQ